jgi:hypothetical protein
VQSKLEIDASDDAYEREADAVAERVMRMPETERPKEDSLEDGGRGCASCVSAGSSPFIAAGRNAGGAVDNPLWRSLALGSVDAQSPVRSSLACRRIQRESVTDDPEERVIDLSQIQAKRGARSPSSLPLSSTPLRLGSGHALADNLRAFFEPRLGRDLAGVRLHTDASAAASARAIDARAFTVGRRIAFAAGEYAPETAAGRRLLAHELVHTIQQAGGEAPRPMRRGWFHESGAATASPVPERIQRAQTARPSASDPFFTYELDAAVRSFRALAAYYGAPAVGIRSANPGVRQSRGAAVRVPALHLPSAATGAFGGTGPPGVAVKGAARPVEIRWSPFPDANLIGRVPRGAPLPEVFGPASGGFAAVIVDPAQLRDRADGIVDELRALGLVSGPASVGDYVLGFVPAENVIEARFGQTSALQALAVAYSEYGKGVFEDPPCTNRGPEVDNYTGVRGPLPVRPGTTRTGRCGRAWCAYFVRWCLNRVGIPNRVGGSAVSVKTWGQSRGWYHPVASTVPQPGDIFFKHPSGSTGHPCDTDPCVSRGRGTGHVGFVLSVSGSTVTTVEGNIHGAGETNDGVRSLPRPFADLEGVVRIP